MATHILKELLALSLEELSLSMISVEYQVLSSNLAKNLKYDGSGLCYDSIFDEFDSDLEQILWIRLK